MKVLMLFYDLAGGAGIQRVIATLSGALAEKGVPVHVAVTSADTRSFFPIHERVVIHRIPAEEPKRASRVGRWGAKMYWAASVVRDLLRYVKDNDITHVIDHGTALGLLYPLNYLGRARFVLFRHFPVNAFPNGALVYRALMPLKRHANVVVLTHSIRRQLHALGYRNVNVIPNPLGRSTPGAWVAKERVILGVGRDNPQKGFDILVRAFASLASTDSTVTLRIIGPGIPLSPTLLPLIAQLGLQHRICLRDATRDISAEVDRATIVVLPSRYEALPMFMLEAMARGAAVVGTDVDGIRDFIRHRENGLLVRAESPDALADAMRTVLTDSELRQRMARSAPASVAHLSAERVAEQWLTYLGSLN